MPGAPGPAFGTWETPNLNLPRPSGGAHGFLGVHQVAQLLGRLEVGHLLRRNLDALAALGVASNARIALADAERPKAANLNLVAALERADHRVEDRLDNHLAVAPRQVARAGHLFHQVCLCHIFDASAHSITGFGPFWHEKIGYLADLGLFPSIAWRNRPARSRRCPTSPGGVYDDQRTSR